MSFVRMSPRHTRSMSVVSHGSTDRPPGYGPRSTIPDVGIVENPEQILRQRRRQNKLPTTVDGIDSGYMEYNLFEHMQDINSDPHNPSIELSFLLEGITE